MAAELRVLDAQVDHAEWLRRWRDTPSREPFSHPAYCSLFAEEGIRATALAADFADGSVLFPVLVKDLGREPWAGPDDRRRDLSVPNGYGGPFVAGTVSEQECAGFWRLVDGWACQERLVAGDVRLSLHLDEVLPMRGWETVHVSDNVVVDLRARADPCAGFSSSLRRNIARAGRSDVEIGQARDVVSWEIFRKLYTETMNRREARSDYYFSAAFFAGLRSRFEDAGLFLAYDAAGEALSGELFVTSPSRSYSLFSASSSRGLKVHANEAVKSEAIRHCADSGRDCYVLGGGNAPDDGLFQYKLRFAPQGRRAYYVGRRVFDRTSYDALVGERQRWALRKTGGPYVPDRFPAYR
ncbi:GNAT family N-acetyltransferase [Streptomyces sp. NPDC098077]|uniref:GNAT family N-acetyltransferase n=1 Tax=Streptomyces sp. NPDC098077 TaxID=3366093 RepID=UPI003812F496